MKFAILFFSLLFNSLYSSAQTFSYSIDIQPSFCRTASFQNGNGSLSAVVTGSTNYATNWYTGAGNPIASTTTIGGLNPGLYVLEVVDSTGGNYVVDSVYLDSINPIADFTVVSSELIDLGNDEYKGYNSANVTFGNNSSGYAQPSNPNSSIVFQWNFDNNNGGGWFFSFDTNSVNNTYGVGIYEVALLAKNFNDCRDTAFAKISVFATSADIESFGTDGFMVIPNFNSKYIDVIQEASVNSTVKIFNMQGQLISSNELIDTQNLIHFDQPKGTYIYQIVKNSDVIYSNKFQF